MDRTGAAPVDSMEVEGNGAFHDVKSSPQRVSQREPSIGQAGRRYGSLISGGIHDQCADSAVGGQKLQAPHSGDFDAVCRIGRQKRHGGQFAQSKLLRDDQVETWLNIKNVLSELGPKAFMHWLPAFGDRLERPGLRA